MTPSETQNKTHSNPSVAALISRKNAYQIIQNASNMARRLSAELRGGRRADPSVTRAAAIAGDLEIHFLAIQHNHPLMQNQRSEPAQRLNVLQSEDLPTIIGAASSDARYLKRLTAGGGGMATNVVEPLRVLRELREKLTFIRQRWPGLQTSDEDGFRMTLIGGDDALRLSRQEKIFQELIASGEVSL